MLLCYIVNKDKMYFRCEKEPPRKMHRSIDSHNPCNPFILTIVYSKKLTTSRLLTIEHMAMFVVKSIHIQFYGQVMDLSIAKRQIHKNTFYLQPHLKQHKWQLHRIHGHVRI